MLTNKVLEIGNLYLYSCFENIKQKLISMNINIIKDYK